MNSVAPIPPTFATPGLGVPTVRLLRTESLVARPTFKVAWYVIVGTHLLLGCLRLFMTALHSIMSIPEVYAALTVLRIPRSPLRATGWCMGAMSIVHFVSAATILRRSWRVGRLTLFNTGIVSASTRQVKDTDESSPSSVLACRPVCLETLRRALSRIRSVVDAAIESVFGVDGVFGVNGRWFFAFFDGLEVLEILSQTYQAYQLSRFVQNAPLITLMVALIAVNCWLPPLLLCVMRENESELARRLAVFAVDLALDLVYAEAIPLLVLSPIVAAYDWQIQAFPPKLGLDDIWGTNSVSQARFLLVTSYMDLITTLVPNVNFLIGIHTIKTLLEARSAPQQTAMGPPDSVKPVPQPRKPLARWFFRFHLVTFLWGVAVVSLHIDASRNLQQSPSCKLPLSPWRIHGSSKSPCAVLYVNCYRLGLTGTSSEIEKVLDEVELDGVTSLIFGHCPRLEIPSTVKQLSNVVGIETFNSTLVQWGDDAALTQSHHPMLHHMYFIHTNMTRLPDAMMHSALPHLFQYLFCYDTNLTQLPDTIDRIWGLSHKWIVLSFIDSPLEQLPDAFASLFVSVLQLLNTKLDRLPDAATPRLGRLRISGANFRDLPSHLDLPDGGELLTRGFFVQNTSVNTLPDWATLWLDAALAASSSSGTAVQASLFGSSVCANPTYAKYAQLCEPDDAFDINAFPYDVIAAQRPL